MEEGHLEGPQTLGCTVQCHSKVGYGVFHVAAFPREAGMGWGLEVQKGPEGWEAETVSSCQVARRSPRLDVSLRPRGRPSQTKIPLWLPLRRCPRQTASVVRAARANQAFPRNPRGLSSRPELGVDATRIPPPFALRMCYTTQKKPSQKSRPLRTRESYRPP